MTFGQRLRTAMDTHGPLCVGIDPHPRLLQAWGLPDDATGLSRFASAVLAAVEGRVAAIKPQSAFFERHGSAGVAVLERLLADARDAGVIVVLDVKRGDIGTTAQAYADAYLDSSSPLFADAITASPYLGFGSLDPMIDTALAHGAGVFVLALTSNPEGPEVQHARREGGETVAGHVLASVAARNAGASPMGSVGVVVGATIGDTTEDLVVNGPLLVPGLGAQGGTVSDLERIFGPAAANVLASSSREVLSAGPDHGDLVAATERTAAALAGLGRR